MGDTMDETKKPDQHEQITESAAPLSDQALEEVVGGGKTASNQVKYLQVELKEVTITSVSAPAPPAK
jgi:hypothetical protein